MIDREKVCVVETHKSGDQVRGTSGALIRVESDYVLKMALKRGQERRVNSQGEFMDYIGAPVFPRVWDITPGSYKMERCLDIDLRKTDHLVLTDWVLKQLKNEIWCKQPRVESTKTWPEKLRRYVLARAAESRLLDDQLKKIAGVLDRLSELSKELTVAEIHGDPTLDNVLVHEKHEKLVLTDPLPTSEPSSKIPSLLSVDVGKLLQSALGYERAKRGQEILRPTSVVRSEMESCVADHITSNADLEASRLFCVVHYVRLIPYQSIGRRGVMLQLLQEALDAVH